MGHGTQINGIQRDITGGMTLVNGIQRKITKGLTLVNGVQREISLGPSICTITMTGASWNRPGCNVLLNGTAYYADQTIEVPKGTEIVCRAYNYTSIGADTITLDGVGVAVEIQNIGTEAFYEYAGTVTSDLTVNSRMTNGLWEIEITTSQGGNK